MCVFFLFFFFFFQAEDGIRDLYVTGVQTCALPIFGCQLFCAGTNLRYIRSSTFAQNNTPRSLPLRMRSEERREGKSVDLGGRRIIKKKKTKTRRTEKHTTTYTRISTTRHMSNGYYE